MEGEEECEEWNEQLRKRRQRARNRKVDGSRHLNREPRREGRTLEIAWTVARRFARGGYFRRDELREFFGAAQLAVTELLGKHREAPDNWIYNAASQAILKAWQASNMIPIPPTTRARWVKNGRVFEDLDRLSYHTVFDSKLGVREQFRREHPQWLDYQEMVLEPSEIDADWMEGIFEFRRLQSVCQDETDERVFNVRWNRGVSLNTGTMLHVEEIAEQLGTDSKEVTTRLRGLESRYYAVTGRKRKPGPMPMGTRTKLLEKSA